MQPQRIGLTTLATFLATFAIDGGWVSFYLTQDNLKELQQDAVILYPFVLSDRLELVLVTPYAPPLRRNVAVKQAELNRAIAKPTSNAKVPARKLYDWLIKLIENDLAQAKTIIYAPDRQLRYIALGLLSLAMAIA